jgi:hypothetical protein
MVDCRKRSMHFAMCNKDVGSFKVHRESYWQGEDDGRY